MKRADTPAMTELRRKTLDQTIAPRLRATTAYAIKLMEAGTAVQETLRDDVNNGVVDWDSRQVLDDLFTSSSDPRRGNYDQSARSYFAGGLVYGYLSVKTVSLPRQPEPLPRHFRSGGGRQSEEHIQLKANAFLWLQSLGWSDAAVEVPWAGYRIDVLSMAGKTFVECGDTEIAKFNSILLAGYAAVLVPYSTREDIGYVFQTTSTGPEWVERVRDDQRKQAFAAASRLRRP